MNIVLIIILLVIVLILIWALMGGKGDLAAKKQDESGEEDRTFRRRASDKEIEKEFPEATQHPMRRKSDASEEAPPPEPDKPFKLPYLADEIIPEISRFRIYRRTLLNSEIYAAKSDYSTAISLYEGVKSRIQDIDTRFKIDANIEYLRHYKKKKDEDTKRKEEQAKRGVAGEGRRSGGNEIKITLGGSLPNAIKIDSLPENINIGLFDPSRGMDMDRIVQSATEKIRGELSDVKSELNRLKDASSEAALTAQTQMASALSGIREHMDGADTTGEMVRRRCFRGRIGRRSRPGRRTLGAQEGIPEPEQGRARDGGVPHPRDRNRTGRIRGQARFPQAPDRRRAVRALLESIPKQKAPGASPIREPGSAGAGGGHYFAGRIG